MLGALATGASVQSNCILSNYMQVKYRIIIIGLIIYNIHGAQVCHAVTWKNSRRRKGSSRRSESATAILQSPRKRKQWSESQMRAAMDAVSKGMSVTRAFKGYGIP